MMVMIDRPSYPPPHALSPDIAAVEHQILQPRSFKLRVRAMLPDQQIDGAPNVEIGDHPLSMAICGTPIAEEDRLRGREGDFACADGAAYPPLQFVFPLRLIPLLRPVGPDRARRGRSGLPPCR
jgi:hypothetical protein